MTEESGKRRESPPPDPEGAWAAFKRIAANMNDLQRTIDSILMSQEMPTSPPSGEVELHVSAVEIETLVQPFLHEEAALDANMDLSAYLNEGWEIVHVAVNSVLETDDDVEAVWHYRIVTLQRHLPLPPVDAAVRSESDNTAVRADTKAADGERESHLSAPGEDSHED